MNKLTIEVVGEKIEGGLSLSASTNSESEGLQELAMLFSGLIQGTVDLYERILNELDEEQSEYFMTCLMAHALQNNNQSKLQELVQSFSKN